jgi:hypothetical protein
MYCSIMQLVYALSSVHAGILLFSTTLCFRLLLYYGENFSLEAEGGGGGSLGAPLLLNLLLCWVIGWVSLAPIFIHRSTRTCELQSMLKIRDEKI